MADIWDAYIKKFGSAPKNATQLQQFVQATANMKPLSFKEARDIFNAHKTKQPVTNGVQKKPAIKIKPKIKPKINKPLPVSVAPTNGPNQQEIKRQMDECNMEINNLNAHEKDFTQNYNEEVKNIENQFKNIYDALKRREMDLKKWRKREFDEGMNALQSTKQILNNRIHDLNTNTNNIYNIPKINDFSITRFTKQSLQIQNTLNNLFQIGQTYQQNINNKQFISLKINKNPQNNINNIRLNTKPVNTDKHKLDFSASPFGKGKIMNNNNNFNQNKKPTQQKNGTKILQYNNNQNNNVAGGIRGFDIGNNAKYANANQTAQNTNTLPSNFWESDSDTDSDKEKQETQQEIVNRWKNQESNITRMKSNENNKSNIKKKNKSFNTNSRSMYDASDSSEDDHDENENDGFEKYIAPKKEKKPQKKDEDDYWKNNKTKWIVYEDNKQFEYDSEWFKVPKMRNGKATGLQMKSFMQKSGLSKDLLKKVWKLSDLDKDGKMGNEEFALCMYLMDKAKKGEKLPDKLPKSYIPPSFRGKKLIKTPPRKAKKIPNSKCVPPKMNLAATKQMQNKNENKPQQKQPKEPVKSKEPVKQPKQPVPKNEAIETKKDETKQQPKIKSVAKKIDNKD